VIRLRAFARYRDRLGFSELELELPAPPTLAALRSHPRLAGLPADALFAVNQAVVGQDAELRDGDEVALMPPVSGG
jgi:molybdopterin converting factor small subunit